MSSLLSLAAAECHVTEKWVSDVIHLGFSRVKVLKIAKKTSHKFRTVYRPSAELEILQRWLTLRFFDNLEVHDSAMAFRKNRSILSNAIRHKNSSYFVRIDFRDFFPSIKLADLIFTIQKSKRIACLLERYSDAETFIERICFDGNHRLPIGYISSPSISNAVLYEFDEKIEKILDINKEKLGKAIVTRYADDIVFSTDIKGGCKEFLTLLNELVDEWVLPSLKINSDKTIFSSKAGGSAMVTGLRICNDNHITITRQYKDSIRLMLSLFSKNSLKVEDIPVLKGHLNYIKHVAPAFFSNLCMKHTIMKEFIKNV